MTQELLGRLQKHISERNLLDHPFYQDWKDGKLSLGDLRLYAAQYYHFEANFPRYLSAIHSRCQYPALRQQILDNLWDEEHGAENHRALWLDFCAGLGLTSEEAEQAPVHPKTRALLDTYGDICSTRSFQEGLAAIYAYEAQVPRVASEKIRGLKEFYLFDQPEAVKFFEVHALLDEDHSDKEARAIASKTDADNEAAVEIALQGVL
jgi:pyrroloquinoline-quinone synthase